MIIYYNNMLTGLEMGLIISLSYVLGFGSGSLLVINNRKKLFIRSRSYDNLSLSSNNNHQNVYGNPLVACAPNPLVVASAPIPHPPSQISKITLE